MLFFFFHSFLQETHKDKKQPTVNSHTCAHKNVLGVESFEGQVRSRLKYRLII